MAVMLRCNASFLKIKMAEGSVKSVPTTTIYATEQQVNNLAHPCNTFIITYYPDAVNRYSKESASNINIAQSVYPIKFPTKKSENTLVILFHRIETDT